MQPKLEQRRQGIRQAVWDKKFELGHERIDFEHSTISAEAGNGSGKERILRLLAELRKYAEFHFLSEENEMLKVNYPDNE
ncbi:MAG: hypothetical protein KZQ88_15690 [Candidatus Thiodiazotropha sp. (ex Dulcina madagascariensis)]|nr:hypothetical protein [Candidatus Thiodiazotropha sp. (ex Dulcina madagascariensis)]MCU7928768.1 hypothetical protein [Candidatus Thiodiazotropha sp. (ex Dulcina madagascariensis)]